MEVVMHPGKGPVFPKVCTHAPRYHRVVAWSWWRVSSRRRRGSVSTLVVTVHPLLQPLASPADVATLNLKPDVQSAFGYLLDAINLARVKVAGAVPVIGFVGGPWTLMAYMIEGGGSRTYATSKKWLFTVTY